jgi:hypothetical protein
MKTHGFWQLKLAVYSAKNSGVCPGILTQQCTSMRDGVCLVTPHVTHSGEGIVLP